MSESVLSDPDHEVSKFGEKVFSYCLQKFGIIYKEYTQSPLFTEEIGDAVVILQLHIRDFLRDYLGRAFGKMVGVIDSNQRLQSIQQLLELRTEQLLDEYPIHTLLLGYLALITEIIIYMDCVGLPVRMDWFTQTWTCIYETRLKPKFRGQWQDLNVKAKEQCDKCPQKEELFEELKALEHPYAEIDPRIETSYKELDPFFMFCTLGTGFEFPRKPGLSNEAFDRLLEKMNYNVEA